MDSSKVNYVLKVFDRKLGLRKILPRLVKKGQLFRIFLTDDTLGMKSSSLTFRPSTVKFLRAIFWDLCRKVKMSKWHFSYFVDFGVFTWQNCKIQPLNCYDCNGKKIKYLPPFNCSKKIPFWSHYLISTCIIEMSILRLSNTEIENLVDIADKVEF